ncbi:hypothetical protein BX616_006817, partial [Lobosporangium transversale]
FLITMNVTRFDMPLQAVKVFSPARDEKDNLWAWTRYTLRGQQCRAKIVTPNGPQKELRAHPAYFHLVDLHRSGENFQWFEVSGLFEACGYQKTSTHSFGVSVRLEVEAMSRTEKTLMVPNEELQDIPVRIYEKKADAGPSGTVARVATVVGTSSIRASSPAPSPSFFSPASSSPSFFSSSSSLTSSSSLSFSFPSTFPIFSVMPLVALVVLVLSDLGMFGCSVTTLNRLSMGMEARLCDQLMSETEDDGDDNSDRLGGFCSSDGCLGDALAEEEAREKGARKEEA